MKSTPPSPAALAAREDLLATLKSHADKLSGMEILALLAYTVGQTIAVQDQRVITPSMAMQLVASNIEAGNRDAIDFTFRGSVGNG